MPSVRVAVQPYTHAKPPAQYDAGFLLNELGKIQRAIPVASIRTVTTDTTASILDRTLLADATNGAMTVTLPAVATCVGLKLTIKKIDVSANAVTIGGTVDGTTNPTLASQYAAMTMQSDGTTWHLLSSV